MWNVKKLTRPDDAPVAMTVLMVVIRGRPVQHASTLAMIVFDTRVLSVFWSY